MYECTICNRHARKTLAGILRHIREVHRHFEGTVRCGIQGCPFTARSYESLRQHMYKKHKAILKEDQERVRNDEQHLPQQGEHDEEDIGSYDTMGEEQQGEATSTDEHASLQGAQFILKTRDGRRITQVALDGILQDTKSIIEHSLDTLEVKVVEKLEESGMSGNEICSIRDLFSSVRNPFEGLESQYKQEQFFEQHFNYVASLKLVLISPKLLLLVGVRVCAFSKYLFLCLLLYFYSV